MGPLHILTATIPGGQAASNAVRLDHGEVLVGIIMPSGWDAAFIGLDSTIDGSAFYPVKGTFYGGSFDFVKISVEASRHIVLDPLVTTGLRWFRLRSIDATGNAVGQSASRTITLIAARIP